MKLGVAIPVLAMMTALAMPAAAQAVSDVDPLRMSAPTISETQAAQSEWYRQFALSKPSDAQPVWQAEPTEDFSMQFGVDSRWQLNVDKLSRPDYSPLPREEVQAGASFRVTPRFSVGGEVSVGSSDKSKDSLQWEDSGVETGVRLKSAFKF